MLQVTDGKANNNNNALDPRSRGFSSIREEGRSNLPNEINHNISGTKAPQKKPKISKVTLLSIKEQRQNG
jgi:hypothetical protein